MMPMITHHLKDDLLAAYATGGQAQGFDLIAAAHISICDECRARLAALESLGGAVMQGLDPEPMADDALDRAMARLSAPDRRPRARPAASVLPAPVRDLVGGDADAVRWKVLGGGVRQAILPIKGRARARLLHIPAGQAVPDHGHGGRELTLVLQGAFRDETGRFGRGDLEDADPTLEHQPVAEAGEDCICLAVTDAPLRFKALIPRILQPLFRI